MTRINQLLKQEVAEQLFRIMHEPGFDISACTVTRVLTSSDLRHARVMISVRGTPEQQQAALNQIAAHRKELQDIINRRIEMKYTPHLSFELDESIAKGDSVLALIAEMEEEHPEWDRRPKGTPPQ